MCNYIKKILIICCFFVLQSCAFSQNALSCDKVKHVILNFVNSGQNSDWNIVEDRAENLKSCKCEIAPIFYYLYRMRAVLPNSQALQDISPNDFILNQKLKMKEQVNILNACEGNLYMPLINAMIRQKFDVEISKSAIDLKHALIMKLPHFSNK